MENNISEIQSAFRKQAEAFNSYQNNAFKNKFSEKMVRELNFSGNESILEIAAGTCALGRLIAPHVQNIVELDITEEMLNEGKKANEAAGITNAEYRIGNAESLPFDDSSFDGVVTRLSFHHFINPDKILREMTRVLKTGGQIGILDMIPPVEKYRDRFDEFEKMRDPSHVHCFTMEELQNMLLENDLLITSAESEVIPMDLSAWMKLTDTEDSVQKVIKDALTEDLQGGGSSGMSPFVENERIKFHRHWAFLVAKK